jgi:hypothetical protein
MNLAEQFHDACSRPGTLTRMEELADNGLLSYDLLQP